MLTEQDRQISFVSMGLFTTEETWIHPKRVGQDFELIYVVNGTVHLKEAEEEIHLNKGDLCLLRPGKTHKGLEESRGHTSFYWVHFLSLGDLAVFPRVISPIPQSYLFKELLHYSYLPNCPVEMKNTVLLHLLYAVLLSLEGTESRLVKEVYEWIRINVDGKMTVMHVAQHFGYHPEHLSRLVRLQYGVGGKSLMDRFLIEKLKERLCHTNFFIKEIADQLNFRDASSCIKFFQYHEGISPSQYRNLYFNTHMNKK